MERGDNMPYFDRTKNMANILIGFSIALFVTTCVVLLWGSVWDQVFQFSNGNYVRNGVIFAILFLLSSFALIGGIALKCVARDAKEELDSIRREFDNLLK